LKMSPAPPVSCPLPKSASPEATPVITRLPELSTTAARGLTLPPIELWPPIAFPQDKLPEGSYLATNIAVDKGAFNETLPKVSVWLNDPTRKPLPATSTDRPLPSSLPNPPTILPHIFVPVLPE